MSTILRGKLASDHLNNFKRIALNNTHTHRDHDGHGQECVKMVFILIKLCLKKKSNFKSTPSSRIARPTPP